MKSVENTFEAVSNSESLTSRSILSLYNATIDELQVCASIKPAANSNGLSWERKEQNLLALEAELLEAAAEVKLADQEDLKNLINIWKKANSLEAVDNIRPSDLIALNIFSQLNVVNPATL